MIKAKDMDTTPRATSIENNSKRGLGRGRRLMIRGNFAVVERVILTGRHEIKNKSD